MRRILWIMLAAVAFLSAGLLGATHAREETRLRIVNGLSRWDIHYIYVSPTTDRSWGNDQLGANEILRPGESKMWRIDPGSYDMRAKDEDGDTYSRYNVCIPEAMTVEWRVTLDDLDRDRN